VEARTRKSGDRASASTIGLRPGQSLVIEREVHIDASPETVFGFFTDPAKLVRWKGEKATLDPRPGGVYRVEMNEQAVVAGEYVEIDPPNRVVFTWGWEGGFGSTPPGSSTVEITLTPDGNGTLVRLVHSGLPTPESVELHGHGWDLYMPRLAVAVVGGDPGPDPNAPKEES
jgi:uncharacterized protein YndB with AHSA1/START domain